jgi:hypothetical protein
MDNGAVPAATVVVSTYDPKRWDDLCACVDSLRRQTRAPLETLVVVDHNDELLERVRAELSGVRAIANERPRGLAGARNAGIAVAAGEVVAFIDDDARAEPDWLERLLGCFDGEAVVGAGGALLPLWRGPEARWLPREFYWTIGCSYTGLPERAAPVRNPIGANMAVRADVLAAVGGFREAGEGAPRELRERGVVRAAGNVPDDTDLAIRVSQSRPGAVWMYEPGAVVHHAVTPERATIGYFVRRSYEEGVGKASLAGLVGAEEGLASERSYAAAVLPRGVARGLLAALRGDPSGALRAAAIVLGTAAAAVGFLGVALRRPRP